MRAITKTIGIFAVLFVAVIFMQRSPIMAAYDQPHTSDNTITCGDCHFASGASTPSWLTTGSGDNTVNNLRCTQCHTGHATHSTTSVGGTAWSTQGGWMVECVSCHNPHYQMQNRKWTTVGYLASGTVASVGAYNAGANETVVTLSAPLTAEYQNYYLVPNTKAPYHTFVYKIKSITMNQTAVTVKGNVKTTAAPYAGATKPFAIVYGKNVKDNIAYVNPGGNTVGSATVMLFRPSGNRGPGDTNPPGFNTETVCFVCHTQVNYVSTVVEHTTSSNCSSCHSHDTGFQPPIAGCADCHGNPPGVSGGSVMFKDKNGNNITSDSTGVGAHAAHDTAGFVCANCHTGGMPPPSIGDNKVNIGFYLSGNLSGTYRGKTGRTVFPYQAGGITTVVANVTANNEDCTNLYCHSTGQGSTEWATTPTYSAPKWYVPATGQCSTCHAVTSAGLTSGSHVVHLNSLVTMGCGSCHTGATASSYSSPLHVNRQVDASNSYTAGGDMGNGYGTCNAAACHGSGSPKWGTTAGKTGCYRCHGDIANGNAAPGPDTAGETWTSGARVGAHQVHLKATNNLSDPIACTECHKVPANVQAVGHLNDATPGVADVVWTSAVKANLNGSTPNYLSDGRCGSTYCHGNAMPKGSTEAADDTPNWNNNAYLNGVASNDCAMCHGYPPLQATLGTIVQHVAKTPTDCVTCHAHVNPTGTGFTTVSMHIDGVLDVSGCTSCHAANNTLPGKHSVHYGSATDVTSRLVTNSSTTSAYIFQCGVCHVEQPGHMGTVSFAALSFNSSWTSPTTGTYTPNTGNGNDTTVSGMPVSTDGTCSNIYCHSNSRPAGGTNSYTVVSWNTVTTCGSCHKTTDTAANMAAAGTPQPMSSAHVKHIATDRYGANANFTCNSCHSGTASNNTTISDKSKHVNQLKEVAFSGWASGAGAAWSGTACSNTYCHSAGTAASGTHGALTWSTTQTCTACHPTTALATGAHAAHVNDTGNKVGFSVACQECHSATTPDGSTISSYVYHVNKNVNVMFDDGTRNKNADNPAYNGSSAWTTIAGGASKAVGAASGNCSNVYCHSNGNIGSLTFSTISWTTTIGCGGCHGDTATNKSHPVYASGTAGSATANSHVKHVESSSLGCDKCHNTTVTTSWTTYPAWATVISGGAHLNRVEDVAFAQVGGKWGSYASASKTCSATYCHGTGVSPSWGTTTNCVSCHDATGSTLSLRHDKHYNSATAPTVLAGGTDAHTTTTYVFACLQCHPTATHTTGPWNSMADAQLNGAKMTWYTAGGSWTTDAKGFKYSVTGTCGNNCHTKDGATAGTAIQAFNWATVATGGGTCGICHNKQGDAAPVWTTAHTKHVNTYSANTNITCNSCHSAVAASNTALQITTLARNSHPNQAKNVAFSGWASGAGATWSGTQCSNTYCHSNGTSATAGTHAAIAWNTTFGCTGCHGGPATWTTTTGTGAHSVHVNSQGYTCNTCHNATASNNTTVTGFAIHVDKNVNIQIINTYTSVAGATYNGNAAAWNTIYAKAVGTTTGTCNTVSCHGGQSPNWGTINTGNAQCTSCHGVKPSTPAAYTADNRLAAPGWNTTGLNTWQTVGAQTNGVSNDAKVGAHRKHLGAYTVWGTIGYANDIACANCHTLYTAVTDAGHMNGSTALVWSSLARNSGTDYTTITGVLSPSFAGGTCSTVYCHGSGFWSSNRGSGLSVGWTSNAYITTVAQAADSASCQRCHLSPPVSNHAGTGAHPGATLSPGGCNSCHGHTGWGTSHIDGKLQASGGSCNSCHWYDTGGAAWTTTNGISGGTGLSMNAASWGAHTKHINHLKARWGSTLNAATDIYGSAAFNNVCGVCHDQTAASTHGPDGGPTTRQIGFNGSTARQFGASAPNWNTVTRSCSSLDCHYKPVNAWGSW